MFKLQELIKANMDTLAVRAAALIPAKFTHRSARLGAGTDRETSVCCCRFYPGAGWQQNSVTKEQGKTLADARGDVFRGLEVVEFACGVGTLQARAPSSEVSPELPPTLFSSRAPTQANNCKQADASAPFRDRLHFSRWASTTRM